MIFQNVQGKFETTTFLSQIVYPAIVGGLFDLDGTGFIEVPQGQLDIKLLA